MIALRPSAHVGRVVDVAVGIVGTHLPTLRSGAAEREGIESIAACGALCGHIAMLATPCLLYGHRVDSEHCFVVVPARRRLAY